MSEGIVNEIIVWKEGVVRDCGKSQHANFVILVDVVNKYEVFILRRSWSGLVG